MRIVFYKRVFIENNLFNLIQIKLEKKLKHLYGRTIFMSVFFSLKKFNKVFSFLPFKRSLLQTLENVTIFIQTTFRK